MLVNELYPYRYETHLHTSPGSRCAKVSVRDNLEFYKEQGFDGVFITNHFLDAPGFNFSKDIPYSEQINFFFKDYEEAVKIGREIGIKVFSGAEIHFDGADFLIYGLDKQWYLHHPEIMQMKRSEELLFMKAEGALVVHAHPFREAAYVDHIHLFPRAVDGVEIINMGRPDFENQMAEIYAKQYGLLPFAGTDNHDGRKRQLLGGMCSKTPIESETEFVLQAKNGMLQIFTMHQR